MTTFTQAQKEIIKSLPTIGFLKWDMNIFTCDGIRVNLYAPQSPLVKVVDTRPTPSVVADVPTDEALEYILGIL